MEKTENRTKYFNDLQYFIKNLEITAQLLNKIKKHKYFEIYEKPLEELKGESLKLFILLELTQERSTCAAIVKILQESNQKEVAERLDEYNKSSGPMALNWKDVQLSVVKGPNSILGRSNTYTLYRYPRGQCIIINNVEDQQTPDIYDKFGNRMFSPKGLKRETIRFEHIFTQLNFDVKVITNLSANQMSEQFTQFSKEKSLAKDEAFAVIVVSHGQDKKVLGYNAVEAMKKISFCKIVNQTDMVEAEQEIENDSIRIKDVVNIFAEENCPQLSSKPKLFFFICFRNRDTNKQCHSLAKGAENYQDIPMTPGEFKEPIFKDGKQVAVKNLDTFVSYSCAEGCYNSEWGMSYFGVALTQSIAQYACDEPLSGIMYKTSNRLKEMFEDMKKGQTTDDEGDQTDSDLHIGNFAIQVNTYAMDRQLYFNPGFDDR